MGLEMNIDNSSFDGDVVYRRCGTVESVKQAVREVKPRVALFGHSFGDTGDEGLEIAKWIQEEYDISIASISSRPRLPSAYGDIPHFYLNKDGELKKMLEFIMRHTSLKYH